MKTIGRHIAQITSVAGIAAVGLVAFGLSATTARAPVEQPFPTIAMQPLPPAEPTVQEMFADAPDGVDSMVTGPVSVQFKAQQQAAGCRDAVWPNVPRACFPIR